MIDARGSRQVPEAVAVLRQLRASGELGDVVVVHIGNNGVFADEQFDQMMRVLRGVGMVLVVNVTVPDSYSWAPNNEVLAEGDNGTLTGPCSSTGTAPAPATPSTSGTVYTSPLRAPGPTPTLSPLPARSTGDDNRSYKLGRYEDVRNADTAAPLRPRCSDGPRAGRRRLRGSLPQVRDNGTGAGNIRRSAAGAAGDGTAEPRKIGPSCSNPGLLPRHRHTNSRNDRFRQDLKC